MLKNVKDVDKAKDIVQDTYEKLWQRINDVESTNAKSYMFTTAYRTMIDQMRREKKQDRLEDSHMYLHTHTKSYTDLKEVLNDALGKLPEIQRSIIMLRDYEGYSYEEIGEITGLNESQVKVYIFRGRKFLKNYIGTIEAVI
jgi:RNA polymerase sigma factor (sigma-70 family)